MSSGSGYLYEAWLLNERPPILVPHADHAPFTVQASDTYAIPFFRNLGDWCTNPHDWAHSNGVTIYLKGQDGGWTAHRTSPSEATSRLSGPGDFCCVRWGVYGSYSYLLIGIYQDDQAASDGLVRAVEALAS